jgi:NDP-hexose-3-ketoreductase
MKMSMVKIGVIGSASVARHHMIPAILNLKDQYFLSGIASRSESKAKELGALFGAKSFNSYESLLNEADLDAVYIPLPNSMHAEWIGRALNRGIHVLVEKPMACDFEDVVQLNQMASEKNLVLVENFQFRFHGQLALINKMVSDGVIGELRCVRSSFGFPPFPELDNIRYIQALGGGALLDAGAYLLKIAQIFLGQNIEVSAANLLIDSKKDVDIWGGGYLSQKDGPMFAEIAFGFDNFYQCRLELWGSKGRIETNRIFTAPPGYTCEITVESPNGKEVFSIEPQNHFEKMLIHFYDLISTKKGLAAEYAQNINQARLIHEMQSIARKS